MLKQVLLNLKNGIPLHLKIEYLRFNVKEGLSIDTTFNPPYFSSDYTVQGILGFTSGNGNP
jgi:hypothetical protein